MKIKQIALAIAAVLAAPAAFAADLTSGVPAGNIFYIGGASAQTPGLAKAMVKFCSGTLTTYLDDQDGKQAAVWACSNANTATSGLTGAFVVSKVDAGGSFAGVNSATNSINMKFPDITNTGAVNFSNAAITAGTLAGSVPYVASTNLRVAQMALSDVSVNIWRARGNTVAATGWTVNPIFAGQGFGVIVSPSLYAALQADQGVGTGQPSISKTQYANVVTGTTGIWQNLLPNTAAPASSTLLIARRSSTSGTQAASDIYFLNNPCNSGTKLGGALAPKSANFVDGALTGGLAVTVINESSTGNVKSDVSNAAGFALGVVSLENSEAGLGGAKYVKINGVSPTAYNGVADTTQKLSVVNGQYDFAYEAQMITNDALTPANGPAQTLADRIVKDQGDGANLTTSTGLYADPNNALLAYTPGHTSNYTRSFNECKPAAYSF